MSSDCSLAPQPPASLDAPKPRCWRSILFSGEIGRILLEAAVITVALFWVFTNADSVSVSAHEEYLRQLRYLRQADTRIDSDILHIRFDLNKSYDVISNDISYMGVLLDQSQNVPNFLSKDSRNELREAVKGLAQLQMQKNGLIETLMRENAILRNSTRYFPTLARQLDGMLGESQLHNEFDNLTNDVLVYMVSSDEMLSAAIKRQIASLRDEVRNINLSPQITQAFKNVLDHAVIMVDGKQTVDSALREISLISTDVGIEQINRIYAMGYADAANRSRGFRVLLFASATMFALYLVLLFARLKRTAQALQDTNRDLEQHVEELRNTQTNLNLYATFFTNAIEGMAVTDAQARILVANPAFSSITGYGFEEIHKRSPLLLRSNYHEPAFYDNIRTTIEQFGKWQGEVWNRRKSGEVYPAWLSISTVYDSAGGITNYIGIFSDMTERKKSEAHIQHLALHDPLTNLPNRLLMQERLNEALTQSLRLGNHTAVLFLNLDRFRNINDTLGNELGDALLRQVSSRCQTLLRTDNTDTISRLGSDEFVFILPNISQPQYAADIARKLLVSVSRPYLLGGHDITITASIGIALSGSDGNTVAELLRNADAAMSRAKEDGRNNFRFYSADMNITTLGDLLLENQLRNAIKHNELELFYQPKINARTGMLQGAEALLRWRHPEQGMIQPDRFIRLAEESGLIVPIGTWVLHTACRQIHEWQEAGLPVVPVAVNLSAHQFIQNDLTALVSESLESAHLDPSLLELELTESMLMRNVDRTVGIISCLRQMGLSLAIDDFGTGYSSLSYLKRFEINVLKIDKSFVADIQGVDTGGKIAVAIIGLAHALGLKVVAEGVELETQRRFLLDHGCDIFQGYLFSRPIPAQDFAQKLAELKRTAAGN
ncbi:MAG: EAL domain-containing protein [Azoarcus sp.]|jgi:diguanylate cyclase (GGDEF)-like protein/PAS domain S-box-containing protein|nr:EAL domain-containing protein [Azoarcus sp.]